MLKQTVLSQRGCRSVESWWSPQGREFPVGPWKWNVQITEAVWTQKYDWLGRGLVNAPEDISRFSWIYKQQLKQMKTSEKETLMCLFQRAAWCICVSLHVTKAKQRESEWVLWALTQLNCTVKNKVTMPDLLPSPWARIRLTAEWAMWNGENGNPGLTDLLITEGKKANMKCIHIWSIDAVQQHFSS